MRKVLIIILLFYVIAVNSYAQSTWFWQSPYPTGNRMIDVHFPTPSTGFAAGNSGTILKTTNFGENWSIVNQGFSQPTWLEFIHFSNVNTGYVTSDQGIYRTINGGQNWSNIPSSFYFKYNVFTINKDSFFVISANGLYRSFSGGQSYHLVNDMREGKEILFINGFTGFYAGEYISKTTNLGDTWYPTNSFSYNYKDIFFIDDSIGYAVTNKEVHRSTDEGENWTKIFNDTSNINGNFNQIFFTSSSTGYATTSNQRILKTTNFGYNWNVAYSGLSGRLFFPKDSIGIIIDGSINRSTDFSNSWTNLTSVINTGNSLFSSSFPNSNTGFLVGKHDVLKTINKGNKWSNINFSSNGIIHSIDFLNADTGYIYDENGTLFKTLNGGENWSSAQIGKWSYPRQQVKFLNADTGFITNRSNLLVTTNGGLSWNLTPLSNSVENASKIFFVNDLVGYAISTYTLYYPPYSSNTLLSRTTNSGLNWFDVYNFDNHLLEDLYFIDEDTGIVCGLEGAFRTVNGGLTWNLIGCKGTSITFTENGNGFVPGFKSTDRGRSWFENQIPGFGATLFHVNFFDDHNGFLVYGNGIIRTTDGGGTVSINNISNLFPSSFFLHQNYPNPFNPSTRIKFDIPKGALVKLKVYDMLGREVAELVNEKLNAGVYEYEWNGMGLPSGVYFYRLEAGEYVETRRMVLVK